MKIPPDRIIIIITINHDVMLKCWVRFMSENEHKVVTADTTKRLQAAFKCIGIEKQLP